MKDPRTSSTTNKTHALGQQQIGTTATLVKDKDGYYDPTKVIGSDKIVSKSSFPAIQSQKRFQIRDGNIQMVLEKYQGPLWWHFDSELRSTQSNDFKRQFILHTLYDPRMQSTLIRILGNNYNSHVNFLFNPNSILPNDRNTFDRFNVQICNAFANQYQLGQIPTDIFDEFLKSWYTAEIQSFTGPNYAISSNEPIPIKYATYMSYIMRHINQLPDKIQKSIAETMTKTFLFTDSSFSQNEQFAHNDVLLPRGAVLATPCKMAYDDSWNLIKSTNEFALLNSAALNIGESHRGKSPDFDEFSANGKLDESKVMDQFGRIVDNMYTVAEAGKFNDLVGFFFGMGAFLRNLDKGDRRYALGSDASFQLRKKMAKVMLEKLKDHDKITTFHFCMPKLDSTHRHFKESQDNFNAFIEALNEADAGVKARVKIYINHDATHVAQSLADQAGKPPYTTALMNGANQSLIGNHCYESGAENAIDENIHRRSPRSLEASALCNNLLPLGHPKMFTRITRRDELSRRLLFFEGKIPANQYVKHLYTIDPQNRTVQPTS